MGRNFGVHSHEDDLSPRWRRENVMFGAIIVLAAGSIAFGAIAWLWTGDSRFLLFCLPLLLFLS